MKLQYFRVSQRKWHLHVVLGADMIKNGRDLEDRMDFKFIAIVSKTIIDYNFLTS